MSKSHLIDSMLETARDLGLSPITMKEIDVLALNEIKPLNCSAIRGMRLKEKLSQAVIAKILNVTPSTYQKWERGAVQPKGANLKLLRLAYTHGIKYIIA